MDILMGSPVHWKQPAQFHHLYYHPVLAGLDATCFPQYFLVVKDTCETLICTQKPRHNTTKWIAALKIKVWLKSVGLEMKNEK